MKEFGSDFHYIQLNEASLGLISHYYPDAIYYASGRQALIDLYYQMGWKRMWMPDYFCYKVMSSLKSAGVNVAFYFDYPLNDDNETVHLIPFEKGDVLFRMNYFGMRARRTNYAIPIPVIEDHSHDLIGDWAMNSDADWCIASLRKTLPLAEGGILWSPKGLKTISPPIDNDSNQNVAKLRWDAMREKTLYLDNKINDKNGYRSVMVSTEDQFDTMKISAMDEETETYLKSFDVQIWYQRKKENHALLKGLTIRNCIILEPECENCNPFSLTLLFEKEKDRNRYRENLINHCVYPAIIWNIPYEKQSKILDFSQRMLSIHCDARYSIDNIIKLQNILESI